jgi:hypothetical protein
MVVGSAGIWGVTLIGVSTSDALLVVLLLCLLSAYAGWRLHKACDLPHPKPVDRL